MPISYNSVVAKDTLVVRTGPTKRGNSYSRIIAPRLSIAKRTFFPNNPRNSSLGLGRRDNYTIVVLVEILSLCLPWHLDTTSCLVFTGDIKLGRKIFIEVFLRDHCAREYLHQPMHSIPSNILGRPSDCMSKIEQRSSNRSASSLLAPSFESCG